ncbi:uncharacterized protein MONBRDRAFT_11674 [Monosiga brevicollis MX1]|uniref:PH domain-containing protein n=1 Tax=Monosiga brevicollis TaxID=81824 RepID=A9V9Y6_MONBE|nr:uncharacterized protein MONBRDRAFT_11674 [Monosiga brevicollis MX1]EDQ85568.1 predicted protein [Monosiga brevicollis MX1]|eukprot:XP_001749517.1 hypothetical protein [Monosiga brevicollis MX1]
MPVASLAALTPLLVDREQLGQARTDIERALLYHGSLTISKHIYAARGIDVFLLTDLFLITRHLEEEGKYQLLCEPLDLDQCNITHVYYNDNCEFAIEESFKQQSSKKRTASRRQSNTPEDVIGFRAPTGEEKQHWLYRIHSAICQAKGIPNTMKSPAQHELVEMRRDQSINRQRFATRDDPTATLRSVHDKTSSSMLRPSTNSNESSTPSSRRGSFVRSDEQLLRPPRRMSNSNSRRSSSAALLGNTPPVPEDSVLLTPTQRTRSTPPNSSTATTTTQTRRRSQDTLRPSSIRRKFEARAQGEALTPPRPGQAYESPMLRQLQSKGAKSRVQTLANAYSRESSSDSLLHAEAPAASRSRRISHVTWDDATVRAAYAQSRDYFARLDGKLGDTPTRNAAPRRSSLDALPIVEGEVSQELLDWDLEFDMDLAECDANDSEDGSRAASRLQDRRAQSPNPLQPHSVIATSASPQALARARSPTPPPKKAVVDYTDPTLPYTPPRRMVQGAEGRLAPVVKRSQSFEALKDYHEHAFDEADMPAPTAATPITKPNNKLRRLWSKRAKNGPEEASGHGRKSRKARSGTPVNVPALDSEETAARQLGSSSLRAVRRSVLSTAPRPWSTSFEAATGDDPFQAILNNSHDGKDAGVLKRRHSSVGLEAAIPIGECDALPSPSHASTLDHEENRCTSTPTSSEPPSPKAANSPLARRGSAVSISVAATGEESMVRMAQSQQAALSMLEDQPPSEKVMQARLRDETAGTYEFMPLRGRPATSPRVLTPTKRYSREARHSMVLDLSFLDTERHKQPMEPLNFPAKSQQATDESVHQAKVSLAKDRALAAEQEARARQTAQMPGGVTLGQYLESTWAELMNANGHMSASQRHTLLTQLMQEQHEKHSLLEILRERQQHSQQPAPEASHRQRWTGDLNVDVYGTQQPLSDKASGSLNASPKQVNAKPSNVHAPQGQPGLTRVSTGGLAEGRADPRHIPEDVLAMYESDLMITVPSDPVPAVVKWVMPELTQLVVQDIRTPYSNSLFGGKERA